METPGFARRDCIPYAFRWLPLSSPREEHFAFGVTKAPAVMQISQMTIQLESLDHLSGKPQADVRQAAMALPNRRPWHCRPSTSIIRLGDAGRQA
jgi:hypothetical protein